MLGLRVAAWGSSPDTRTTLPQLSPLRTHPRAPAPRGTRRSTSRRAPAPCPPLLTRLACQPSWRFCLLGSHEYQPLARNACPSLNPGEPPCARGAATAGTGREHRSCQVGEAHPAEPQVVCRGCKVCAPFCDPKPLAGLAGFIFFSAEKKKILGLLSTPFLSKTLQTSQTLHSVPVKRRRELTRARICD